MRCAALLAFALLCVGTARTGGASPSLGVADFAGDGPGPRGVASVAQALADAMARRDLDRLLPPGRFVAKPGIEARAGEVREWAYAAAVDAIVLGRITPAADGRPARLDIVVHSGHSGAERARYMLDLPPAGRREAVLDDLAGEILEGLGYVAAVPVALPIEAEEMPAATGPAGGAGGRGLDAALDLEGFDGDAPIEIKADEAEIVSREYGRELVFQRNVRVRQANVTLRSDRLEATYRRGHSEPERLIADGDVFVDQGGRRAKCDHAIYVRSDQRLTCTGRAELVQGCDVVRGDSIQFWLADDRARVEGAASIVIRPEQGAEAPAGCPTAEGRS